MPVRVFEQLHTQPACHRAPSDLLPQIVLQACTRHIGRHFRLDNQ